MRHRVALVVVLLAVALPSPAPRAQTAAPTGRPPGAAAASEDARDRAFVEGLRREDPASADRYLALRDARNRAIAEVQKAEATFNAAGRELRGLSLPRVRAARRKYVETSLALLDFLDARDRRALQRYHEEIDRLTAILDERAKTRAELEKMAQQ